jgi:hypothetical protein
MRYAGGLLGGSWLTAMTSDLGHGIFDGAWLVQNFEHLNPGNTLWTKQYNLYANIDTEARRYLGFERWWGGHVYLNGPEIQYIVDNLFIGNRLATARLVTSDGIRIDLRNIQSPIIVFCSKGDNITPPPQALGWITDLYQHDGEVQAHGQTIVYAVHESIGHLGIFVSGNVARKEHQEFASNIDMIDVLPPGIYQAEFEERTADTLNAETAGDYVMTVENRTLDDISAIVEQIPEDDKRFAVASRISQLNLGLYRNFVQPWVRAAVTPQAAEWMQHMHPLRLPYELISDQNPMIAPVAELAEAVREHRRPAPADNPFLLAQNMASNWIEAGLNIYQELRDSTQERLFMNIYGSPLVQAWSGLAASDRPARQHPGVSPEHRDFLVRRQAELQRLVTVGGLHRAAIRMLLYVIGSEGGLDERSFAVIRRLRTKDGQSVATLERFKELMREQTMVMHLDPAGSLRAMPRMLSKATAEDIRAMLASMKEVLEAAQPLNERARTSLREMERVFETAARHAEENAAERIPAGNALKIAPLPSARTGEAAADAAPPKAVRRRKSSKT